MDFEFLFILIFGEEGYPVFLCITFLLTPELEEAVLFVRVRCLNLTALSVFLKKTLFPSSFWIDIRLPVGFTDGAFLVMELMFILPRPFIDALLRATLETFLALS